MIKNLIEILNFCSIITLLFSVKNKMTTHWDYSRLCNEIIGDNETCVKWCEENGLLPKRSICKEGHEMLFKQGDSYIGYFMCNKKHSNGRFIRFTRTRGTVFETRRMPPEKFLNLVYCFVNDVSYRNSVLECSMDGASTSKNTVQQCFTFCRELITYYLLESSKDSTQIGGPSKRVEIMELFLDIRKFSFCKFAEGTYVILMIEHDSKEFCVVPCPEEEFNIENMCALIKKNVAYESVIIQNFSTDYSSLSKDKYIITGINFEGNEAYTQYSKQLEKLSKGGVDKLLEHLFKTDMKRKNKDVFEEIITIIRHAFPVLSC